MAFPMPGIGILFNIDDLGGGHYGYQAWRIFMRNVSSEELCASVLVEGDTLRNIGGESNLFCIGVYGFSDVRVIRERFESLSEPGLAAMPSRVVEKVVLDTLPLPIHGNVDAFGRLVTEQWNRMDHDLCKEAGWGYAPKKEPADLEEPLRGELKYMKVDWPLEQVTKSRSKATPPELKSQPSVQSAKQATLGAKRGRTSVLDWIFGKRKKRSEERSASNASGFPGPNRLTGGVMAGAQSVGSTGKSSSCPKPQEQAGITQEPPSTIAGRTRAKELVTQIIKSEPLAASEYLEIPKQCNRLVEFGEDAVEEVDEIVRTAMAGSINRKAYQVSCLLAAIGKIKKRKAFDTLAKYARIAPGIDLTSSIVEGVIEGLGNQGSDAAAEILREIRLKHATLSSQIEKALSLCHVVDSHYGALDQLLAEVEAELGASRAMPIRRLRRKQLLGGQVVGWSHSDRQGGLDLKGAEQFLNARLATIGLGLSGPAAWTSDHDGSPLAFWGIGHAQFSDTPLEFKQHIQRLEDLETEQQRAEANRLAQEKNFALLIAWMCEAKYFGIPCNELKACSDDRVVKNVIHLLQSSRSDIRQRAASMLGPLGGEAAGRALCSILPQAEDRELMEIASALFRLPSENAVQPLTEALHRTTDFYQRVSVAKSLARSGGQEGFDVLIAGLADSKGENEYAHALLAVDDPRANPALKEYLGHLQMRGASESYQEPVREFLARHGQPVIQEVPAHPAEIQTSLGFKGTEAAWSVQPSVVKLREAIKNTWNVNCRILELSEERAELVRQSAPSKGKQWVQDGQYQIECGLNSIFIHAHGSWCDFGDVMFLYRDKIHYVNVAPGVDLTRFIYDRTDTLSHMAKIAITLSNHIGANRKNLLICLEGDLAQGSGY